MSISRKLLQTQPVASGGRAYFTDFPYTVIGSLSTDNTTGPSSKSACFERTSDFGYTNAIWKYLPEVSPTSLRRLFWNGSSWVITHSVPAAFGTYKASRPCMADSGTHIITSTAPVRISGVTTSSLRFLNKETLSITNGPTLPNVASGAAWDGTNFWVGSATSVNQFYRIGSNFTSYTTFTLSPSPNQAVTAAFYDWVTQTYYVHTQSNYWSYTFNGSTFTNIVNGSSTYPGALNFYGTALGESDMVALSETERYVINIWNSDFRNQGYLV
jgi:hypothetical protein